MGNEIQNTILLKRYKNRKMYDYSTSSYVVLEDIAKMIKAGSAIYVKDVNGEDITNSVLLKVLADEEKRFHLNANLPYGIVAGILTYLIGNHDGISDGFDDLLNRLSPDYRHWKTSEYNKIKEESWVGK